MSENVFMEVAREQGARMSVAEIKTAIYELSNKTNMDARAFMFGLQEVLVERLEAA